MIKAWLLLVEAKTGQHECFTLYCRCFCCHNSMYRSRKRGVAVYIVCKFARKTVWKMQKSGLRGNDDYITELSWSCVSFSTLRLIFGDDLRITTMTVLMCCGNSTLYWFCWGICKHTNQKATRNKGHPYFHGLFCCLDSVHNLQWHRVFRIWLPVPSSPLGWR